MAERRMFAKSVVCSDTFLDLDLSTQVLYFHLAMNADDDGFVTPKKIIRMTGTKENDLEVLASRGFVILFPSGVACIRHWKVNNLIKTDRYVETEYKAEMGQLKLVDKRYEEIGSENEVNTDSEILTTEGNIDMGSKMVPNGFQMGSKMVPQDRLGKDRTGEERISLAGDKKESSRRFLPPTTQEVQAYLDELGVKSFDGERFCDSYTAKGWMIGKNRMKDWKACVRTWIRNDKTAGIDLNEPVERQKGAYTGKSGNGTRLVQRDVTGQYSGDLEEEAN